MKDYSNRNLQNASFVDQDLRYANFSNSDLRGADFSGANLNGVDFTGVRTGIVLKKIIWMFIIAFGISLLSGYLAMLGGKAVQTLMLSKNEHERTAGALSVIITLLFIIYAWQKGGGIAIRSLIIPIVVFALVVSLIIYLSGIATGRGMFFLALSLLLVAVMFITGTVARTVAGSLSNIYFIVVALSGEIFSKSVGGGIGTVILAFLCAMISKKALKNNAGFSVLRKVAIYITRRYGTSFRDTKMVNTRFANSKIRNADFGNTDVSLINWGNSKRINCVIGEAVVITK